MNKENAHESLIDKTIDFTNLERLDQMEYDDYISAMNARADVVEYVLNSAESTLLERSEYRQELDEHWKYSNQKMKVSGWAYKARKSVLPNIPEYERHFLDREQEVVSTGFKVLPFSVVVDDSVLTYYKVALSFEKGSESFAMLRDECLVKFPKDELATSEKRLLYYHSDEVVKISKLVDNHDPEDGATVVGFKEYEVKLLEYSYSSAEHLHDLEVYLYNALQFDDELPYVVSYQDQEVAKAIRVIAQPTGIAYKTKYDDVNESPRTYVPWLKLSMIHSNKSLPNTDIELPIWAINECKSIRHILDKQ